MFTCDIFMCLFCTCLCIPHLKWTRSWVSRTSTSFIVFLMMMMKTRRCLVRRRKGRVRRSCRRPFFSSPKLALMHCCEWSSGNRTFINDKKKHILLREYILKYIWLNIKNNLTNLCENVSVCVGLDRGQVMTLRSSMMSFFTSRP